MRHEPDAFVGRGKCVGIAFSSIEGDRNGKEVLQGSFF
jgi:hypothetical protein